MPAFWRLLSSLAACLWRHIVQPTTWPPWSRTELNQKVLKMKTETNEDSDAEHAETERLQTTSWCSCGKCDIMPTSRECICCVEEPESENKLKGNTWAAIWVGLCDVMSKRPGCKVSFKMVVTEVAFLRYLEAIFVRLWCSVQIQNAIGISWIFIYTIEQRR